MNSSNSLWIAILVVWIAGSTWWHVCKIKLLCSFPSANVIAEPAPEIPSLSITDGESLALTSLYNFSFARSGNKANVSKISTELDSVAGYLRQFPDKRIILTGLYASNEINATSFPNLGIARAEDIKAYYVSKGFRPSVFITKGSSAQDLTFIGDSLWGGIEYAFTDALTLTENSLAEQQKFEGIFKPLDLYFNTGSVSFIRTDDNERFLEEARLFLSQNKDKKLLLTGHTDNVGAPADNMRLSMERAESVKELLTESGIPADQISADAKGQTQPKVPNDTPEGQAVNRRVSIVVSD
jgi:OOP family OmpA-OmpF porin